MGRRGNDGEDLSGATNDSSAHIVSQTATNATCTMLVRRALNCAARAFCRDCKQDYDCSIEHAASRIMTAEGGWALKQMDEHAIRVLRSPPSISSQIPPAIKLKDEKATHGRRNLVWRSDKADFKVGPL